MIDNLQDSDTFEQIDEKLDEVIDTVNSLTSIEGGTTDQMLVKGSNDDYDFEWQTQPSPVVFNNTNTGNFTLTDTSALITGATYTTLNDGKTRKYIINFSCTIRISEFDSTERQSEGIIELKVGDSVVAESRSGILLSTSEIGSRGQGTVTISYAASIAPNTVIEIKGLKNVTEATATTIASHRNLSIFGF